MYYLLTPVQRGCTDSEGFFLRGPEGKYLVEGEAGGFEWLERPVRPLSGLSGTTSPVPVDAVVVYCLEEAEEYVRRLGRSWYLNPHVILPSRRPKKLQAAAKRRKRR